MPKKTYRQIENTDYYVSGDGTVMVRKGRHTFRLVPSGSRLVRPPCYDEDELDALVEKGTKAWAGVGNATEWVEGQRGGA